MKPKRLGKKKEIAETGNTIVINKKYFQAMCKFHKVKYSTSQFEGLLPELKRVPVKEKKRIINLLAKMKPREKRLR